VVESDDVAGYWLSVCGHDIMTARNTRRLKLYWDVAKTDGTCGRVSLLPKRINRYKVRYKSILNVAKNTNRNPGLSAA